MRSVWGKTAVYRMGDEPTLNWGNTLPTSLLFSVSIYPFLYLFYTCFLYHGISRDTKQNAKIDILWGFDMSTKETEQTESIEYI
jgi:hypothetical protein